MWFIVWEVLEEGSELHFKVMEDEESSFICLDGERLGKTESQNENFKVNHFYSFIIFLNSSTDKSGIFQKKSENNEMRVTNCIISIVI